MMQMTVSEQGGVVQLSLGGRMDLLGVEDIGAPFTDTIGERGAPVAVDLSRVDLLASVRLRLLFANACTLQEHRGKMALSGAQASVQAVLDSTGVPKVIPCSALESLRRSAEWRLTAYKTANRPRHPPRCRRARQAHGVALCAPNTQPWRS